MKKTLGNLKYYKLAFAGRDNLDDYARYAASIWSKIYVECEAEGLKMTEGVCGILDRLVRARTEYQFLYAEAMAEGPTITAKSGGQFANQRYHAVRKLDEDIIKLESSLLISPKAKAGKIIPPKAASKPSDADEFV